MLRAPGEEQRRLYNCDTKYVTYWYYKTTVASKEYGAIMGHYDREKPKTLVDMCPSVTLSTTNLTCTGLVLNTWPLGEKPAGNQYNQQYKEVMRNALFWAWFLTPEDGTDRLSRNVGKELPLLEITQYEVTVVSESGKYIAKSLLCYDGPEGVGNQQQETNIKGFTLNCHCNRSHCGLWHTVWG